MPKEKSDHWKQEDEKSRSYLIKRSNSFRDLKKNNSKKKGYFEITISKNKRNPPSHKLKMHDIIYVAETSGGIYAKGKVVKTFSVDVFSTIEEVLDYSKQFKDDSYWLDKIRLFKDKLSSDPNYKLSSKHRDRPKKELQKIMESYSDNIQAKALKVIKQKWDELLSV